MKLLEFVKRIYEKFNRHDCFGLSAEISYQSLFSMFPFILLLVSIAGLLSKYSGIQAQFFVLIYDFAPPMAIDFINSAIVDMVGSNSLGVFGLSLLITIWAGSTVMDSTIKAFDRIYEVEESRSFFRRKIVSMVLLIVAVFLFILSTLFVFIGDTILEWVGGGNLPLEMLQVAGTFILVTLNILLLNRFAPNINRPLHRLLPGAAFFSFVWILATYIFRFYVRNFGRYSVIYGSIGGIIVLLTWIYITAILLLIGALINSILIQSKGE